MTTYPWLTWAEAKPDQSRSCLFTDSREGAWQVAWVWERESWIAMFKKQQFNAWLIQSSLLWPAGTQPIPFTLFPPCFPFLKPLAPTAHLSSMWNSSLVLSNSVIQQKITPFVVRFIFLLVSSLRVLSMEPRQDHCSVREGGLRGPNRHLLIRIPPVLCWADHSEN